MAHDIKPVLAVKKYEIASPRHSLSGFNQEWAISDIMTLIILFFFEKADIFT
jgi:hypothetical protein